MSKEDDTLFYAPNEDYINMFPFQYKDGTAPKAFDVVTFNVYDSDDFVTWKFICILTEKDFIYISGGCDNGLAMGNRISFEQAIKYSEDNDSLDVGFTKLGTHYQISSVIAKGFGL